MKRILITLLALALMLSAVACGASDQGGEDTTTASESEATTVSTPATTTEPSVNEGTLKAGVYTATSSYASGEMNMTWNFVLTLKEDGSFTLTDDAATEKGAGTYALSGDCYTLSYSDGRSCTFVAQEDGTLKITSDFPYGIAQIQLALVGDIVFSYDSKASEAIVSATTTVATTTTTAATTTTTAPVTTTEPPKVDEPTVTYAIAAGTYAASYEKVSAMAGTVVYKYTATVGEDGSFSYKVGFDMGGTAYEGSSASGTYKIEGDKFIFTDSENNVTEGKLTADNTLVISLKASAMASTPYEVTFTPAE